VNNETKVALMKDDYIASRNSKSVYNTTFGNVSIPASFMDWTFYASYVNNFNFS
jgi:hypothetical protein